MFSKISSKTTAALGIRIGLIASLALISACATPPAATIEQKSFASPEEAVTAFVNAMKDNNASELRAIFGSGADELISSGDPVMDERRRDLFAQAYDKQHSIQTEKDTSTLIIGTNEWPFPIPIVKEENRYWFNTNAGAEEITNRRVGLNELSTIQSLLALVDAEREYAAEDRDGDGLLEYARKFHSDPGTKNGLYWKNKEGEMPSPAGPLFARARQEGYDASESADTLQPYHGYFYKLLTSQGSNAAGGAFDYLVKGKLIGGFAVVAYPAEYGNSGVMTFLVNHEGVVYQKDLGRTTERQAKAIASFNPDNSWTKAQ